MNAQTKALEVFGADRQVDKCIEELGELATALVKYRHGEATADHVIDELADVMVTTGTLWLLFDKNAIEARIAVKLARLSRLCADQVQAKAKPEPEPKPEPNPKPAPCWSPWQGGYTLQWLGFVTPRDTMWRANFDRSGGGGWYPTMQEAMRAVELHHGLDEVDLWTP